ncbi:hypothetical protein QJS10_CPB04g00434 [Acorus calamus]|uniref:Uncharacterized protein n=1 Tax=Acorus calamus TaxID=4465 RepID=A0AAV9F408_ACOCL|nr:hypothetical protein QJS10_CPB04g00434 [Acorus calamus]
MEVDAEDEGGGGVEGEILKSSPEIPVLVQSLENQIIPAFEFLEGIVGTKEDVITFTNRSIHLPNSFIMKRLMPNISYLRDHGVPASHI